MAKTTMPIMSASASGALAKAVVFMTWKGLNDVRKYLIPANPRTTAQVAQRTRFTNAVDEFHTAEYNDADRKAWNRYAGILAKVMSGFNAMIKTHISYVLAGKTWITLNKVRMDKDLAPTQIQEGENVGDTSGEHMRYGSSPTYMPNDIAMIYDDLKELMRVNLDVLPSARPLYFQIYIDTAENKSLTGIYKLLGEPPWLS
jgi:hypothetical protein